MTTRIDFDYSTLDDDVGTRARAHAERIRELVKVTTEATVEIGRRLLDTRGTMDPRHFIAWLRSEFRWSIPTAWKYMASAEHFGHLEDVGRFDRSALHLLSMKHVPDEARDEAIALAGKGEHVTRTRAQQILRSHDCTPTRRDAGRPRKANARSNHAMTNPDVQPADAVRELRSLLDAFTVRIDEWASRLGADERLALSNQFLELAMQLRRERETPKKTARKRRRATAAA
jgi:hypothetical protein